MKVSVISTVYNGSAFFDKAIPSILNQTYKDFEYVIVDDGSTDDTIDKLKKISEKDSRVKVFHFGRLGRTKALNKAVELCSGEYIFQQDFDDISYPDRIGKQLSFMEQNTDVGVSGTYYEIRDENRAESYVRMFPDQHECLVYMLAKCVPIAHTMACFRKSAWHAAGGYPECDDIEDLELWINMVEKGYRIATVKYNLGIHFVYGNSYWHKNFKYLTRQKRLATVQKMAITKLKMPFFYNIFPLARLLYAHMPTTIKKVSRRLLGGGNEKDI